MSVDKTQMADFGRTQMVSPSGEVTQMAVSTTCPVCKTVSPGGEMYCADCGFLLSSQPVEVAPVVSSVVGKLVDTSGREFDLKPGANTIGRQDTDVLVAHPTVSRSHAKLTVTGSSFLLEDTGSTNGTFVGNAKVEPGSPVQVRPGDEIIFGSVMMRLDGALPEAVAEVVAAEDDAALESVVAEILIATDPDEATDTTPAQALSEPVEPVEIHEDEPTLARFIAGDGTEYIINPGENTVGRRPSNAIAVPDPYISGSHAVITSEEGVFTLTDLGSTNGTFVNGDKLEPNAPRELSDGDEVMFAQVSLRFVI